ncbi:MAG: hypothetical protein EPN33_06870 [Acidobacteria bacterium]|nr:MAG: hypothetical protein EPN33_06870 [Acidobacteriota bacterium]
MEIVAPLSIRGRYVADTGRVVVECPAAFRRNIKAAAFFDNNVSQSLILSNGSAGGFGAEMRWPDGTSFATVHITAEGVTVDSLEVQRWRGSGNLGAAVNGYFDEGHGWLRDALAAAPNRDGRQHNFERGVVRLLASLGFSVISYAEKTGARQSRPDAVIIHDSGTARVVLVECTIEQPMKKISNLAVRVQELSKHLGSQGIGRGVEVRGVIFSATEPVGAEVTDAADHEIPIIGPGQIQNLLARMGRPLPEADTLLSEILGCAANPFAGSN